MNLRNMNMFFRKKKIMKERNFLNLIILFYFKKKFKKMKIFFLLFYTELAFIK